MMTQTEEELFTEKEKLYIAIAEAEERGDLREAAILKTKIPFDPSILSVLRPLGSAEDYEKYISEIEKYRNEKNAAILKQYLG